MKKFLLATVVSTALICVPAAVVLAAAHPDKGPGCGLGKLAWSDYKNTEAIGPQVLMATTNGTFGSQTFGISSGTSGCSNNGMLFAQEKVNVFTAMNFENISQEMAQGQGEHLVSLATLLGVPEKDQPEFFALTHTQYETLIRSGETTPAAMLQSLHLAMEQHPTFVRVATR